MAVAPWKTYTAEYFLLSSHSSRRKFGKIVSKCFWQVFKGLNPCIPRNWIFYKHRQILGYFLGYHTRLRTFAPVATAHRYCARQFPRHVMHRASPLSNKMKNDREDAIATALRGFNSLGHSVTPTFLSRNRFYLQWSTHCPKMNKKWAWEVKKISRFLSTGHRILPFCDCKVHETMVAKFELVL